MRRPPNTLSKRFYNKRQQPESEPFWVDWILVPFAVQYLALRVRPDGVCVISYWGLSYQCPSLKLGILKKPFESKKWGCCCLAWDESYTLELSMFPMLTWYFDACSDFIMVFHGWLLNVWSCIKLIENEDDSTKCYAKYSICTF